MEQSYTLRPNPRSVNDEHNATVTLPFDYSTPTTSRQRCRREASAAAISTLFATNRPVGITGNPNHQRSGLTSNQTVSKPQNVRNEGSPAPSDIVTNRTR